MSGFLYCTDSFFSFFSRPSIVLAVMMYFVQFIECLEIHADAGNNE